MTPSGQLEPPAPALSERVYSSILRGIALGDMQRGARLRIEALAEQLGVSPTPVREALSRLETTGLVVHPPNRGFRIAPRLTADQFDRLMDARELIEVGAIGLASAEQGTSFATALRTSLNTQETAVQQLQAVSDHDADPDDAWAVIDADLEFHRVVLAHTNNPFVELMAHSLSGQSHRVRQSAEHGVSDVLEALAEHAAIARAVESGDRQAAESAMRMHMRLVRVRGHLDIESEQKGTNDDSQIS